MKLTLLAVLLHAFLCAVCIQGKVLHIPHEDEGSLSYDEALQECLERGGSLASPDELRLASYEPGFSWLCSACGWLSNKYHYKVSDPECSDDYYFKRLVVCNDNITAFCYLGGEFPQCSHPLGMEQNVIPDAQITSSSARTWQGRRWHPWYARLNKIGGVNAWMDNGPQDGNLYLQVDFGTIKAISGIITQGAQPLQYVTYFKISYSKRGDSYMFIKDGEDDKVFPGNVNFFGSKRNMFPKVILARFVRFVPVYWNENIGLRLEYLGCELDTYDSLVRAAEEGSTSTQRRTPTVTRNEP